MTLKIRKPPVAAIMVRVMTAKAVVPVAEAEIAVVMTNLIQTPSNPT